MNYKLHGYGVLGSLFRFIWANGFSSIQWAAVTYWTHCTFTFWIIKWFLWFYSILAPFPGILAMRRDRIFFSLSMAFSLAPSGKHEWHSFQFSLITNSYYSKLKSFCIEHFTVYIYHAHASYKQWTLFIVNYNSWWRSLYVCMLVFCPSSSSSSWSLLLLLVLQCSWEKRMPNVFIRFEYRKLNAWKAYAICQCGVWNTQSTK